MGVCFWEPTISFKLKYWKKDLFPIFDSICLVIPYRNICYELGCHDGASQLIYFRLSNPHASFRVTGSVSIYIYCI